MRRWLAGLLFTVLCLESSGASALAASHSSAAPPLGSAIAAALVPAFDAVRGSELVAMLDGQGNRWSAMHAPAPTIVRMNRALVQPNVTRARIVQPEVRYGSRVYAPLPVRAQMGAVHDPRAMLAGASSSGGARKATIYFGRCPVGYTGIYPNCIPPLHSADDEMPVRRDRHSAGVPSDCDADACTDADAQTDCNADSGNADTNSGNADTAARCHGDARTGAAPRHQSLVDLRRGRATWGGQVDGQRRQRQPRRASR